MKKYILLALLSTFVLASSSFAGSKSPLKGTDPAKIAVLVMNVASTGTVFITDSIPDSVTKAVLGIPDNFTRVCITPLGIPVEWPDSPPKKKLEEFIAYETLGS